MSCSRKSLSEIEQTRDKVKEYYGKKLKTTADIKTSACTLTCNVNLKKVPSHIRDALKLCHEDVLAKYYGCGLVFPEVLENRHVLDLGCGAGRDSFALSKMVGEHGHVTGVDMTQELLDVAIKYADYHKDKLGYSKPNTEFKLGYFEDLNEAGVKNSSVDVIVSNGAVNLTSDKLTVLEEARKVLKDGGEIYFSDVYADRHMPDDIRNNEVLWGQCIAGALWWRHLVDICKEVGLSGPYLVERDAIKVEKEEFKKVVGDTKFVSATYRLFKIPRSDESKERFVATYKGSVKEHPDEFMFDIDHIFKNGKVCEVSANIADIIRQSRFAEHFDVKPAVDGGAYAIADPFRGLDRCR